MSKKIFILNSYLNLFFYSYKYFYLDLYIVNKLFIYLYSFFNLNKYINIIFVNKNYIKFLNLKYRCINNYTNVLSFNYNYFNKINIKNDLLGEIIICTEIIFIEYKKNYIYNFLKLLIHSFLHLIGFNHINKLDYKKMKFYELFFIKNF